MAGVVVTVKLSTQLLTAAVSLVEAGPTVVNVSKSRRIEQILVGSEKYCGNLKFLQNNHNSVSLKVPVEHLLIVYVNAALSA